MSRVIVLASRCKMTKLSAELTAIFSLNNFSVCVKNNNKKVLMQNENCIDVCGDHVGTCCTTGCMKLFDNDKNKQWKEQGSFIYKNIQMKDGYFDVHLLCGKKNIITFLTPLKKQQSDAFLFYKDKGLTCRESEIISFVILGCSNKYITEQLAISRATLKSHLNNIYRKIREKGAIPEYIPANRIKQKH